MTASLVESLKSKILDQFRGAIPNGWILGWDENRFFNQLSKILEEYTLTNYTSFDYSFCNKYELECHGNAEGIQQTLSLRISFIADVYSLHWTEYSTHDKTGHVISCPSDKVVVEESINEFMKSNKFIEITGEIGENVIDGVTLELSGNDNITIGKCLFEDYEG